MSVVLTDEQQKFVDWASMGTNVLVDACIGSGKTTSIQVLCERVCAQRSVLYLTYNKLLKLDAKNKIGDSDVFVTNYHGFAYNELRRYNISCGYSDIMTVYNQLHLPTGRYDMLVLDEYQDIDQDIADMLLHVKACNPGIQVVAVGDMDQKIYDRTKLDVNKFIVDFLGANYRPMEFTQCFRLNDEWASALGAVWEKQIVGVNPSCEVVTMRIDDVFDAVKDLEPRQLLVLGQKGGRMSDLQNRLESDVSNVFNKFTVWSKIADQDGGATSPHEDSAVFTTYDGSKGMERDVCVLFDFTRQYWNARLHFDTNHYNTIRNIFCVAASRGKQKIIIVDDGKKELLDFDYIMQSGKSRGATKTSFNISEMFDYKYTEDVEACYRLLDIQCVRDAEHVIDAPLSDGLIDLSPCIGNYQEASYFSGYNLDEAIQHCRRMNQGALIYCYNTSGWSIFGKTLYLTALETNQARYVSQVRWDFVPDWVRDEIHARLAQDFVKTETVQKACNLTVYAKNYGQISLNGVCDVLKDNMVYELKFVSALSHIHYLQCACYMLAMDLEQGVLMNVRDGEKWLIRIPNRKLFLDKVIQTITKGRSSGADVPVERELVQNFIKKHRDECSELLSRMKRVPMTASQTEDFFAGKGLVLPISANQFIRYFQKKGARKSTMVKGGLTV